ncbi:PLP-dependent aminotransferase family protein [Rhizobium halophytocola]|uniref:DNA-binding transcriptional MocR family regulator n=1 Tax=Rhizobium halophytocola TaxID=735519 RepID=A0ABS4DU97_9HYPH|nr:PLP-dependent aminotransferase family protein [Rhizobium halophytocola]MBP1849268.1 DNA-binding transcriptional MocR family regulator [Rhizobium halophytocola]
MTTEIDARWFAAKISNKSIQGISIETSALIRSGLLPVGTRMPSIRDIAYEMGVSPATISEAWSELRRQKILSGRGRNGTWISGDRFIAKPERLASAGNYSADVLDLSQGVPDVDLLPRLDAALAHAASPSSLNSYTRSRIIPELEAAIRPEWPYAAEAFLTTNGGYNGIYAVIHALVLPGSTIAIERPTAMRLLDILEDRGVNIVPVECDAEGPLPASLAAALEKRPAAFLFQPRLHSVCGRTVSSLRLAALGDLLSGSDALIIEDDGVGDVSPAPRQSLGVRFPDRTIHVLSFSKSHGPDLRLAVLSSTQAITDQIQSFRSFSAGWTSRVLQAATAYLIRDPETRDLLDRSRQIYQQRRDRLETALAAHGIDIGQGGGLCCWVPVENEAFAMVTLAARNIAVHPGAKFTTLPDPHIRVATSTLKDRYDEVAEAIMLASRP